MDDEDVDGGGKRQSRGLCDFYQSSGAFSNATLQAEEAVQILRAEEQHERQQPI
jgi:hypothetical protein